MKYLDNVNSPDDLKSLNTLELEELCREIRDFLIENISKTGGHLSSNLGIVELTVALHYCFNSPKDKIIFDVSHQAYVHKIITGRKNEFYSLRELHGLSGFTNKYESCHDFFTIGHSSTSIAMATGMAIARDLRKDKNNIIAVIGDGSLTGGLAYEGLNNAGNLNSNIIVILNDNNMSISKSVGSLTKHLNKLRARKEYYNMKRSTKEVLYKVPIIGKYVLRTLHRAKRYLKYCFINQSIIFEELGFKYIGPIDGHNMENLIDVLEHIKNNNKPIFLHIKTIKGKGYNFAENNPTAFHGVSKFDAKSGIIQKSNSETYSIVAGMKLLKLASKNKDIVVITAAMTDGTGLKVFKRKYPGRFFDVGIAEEYAVSFSAGLSSQGLKPIFLVYSTFLQRAYDQIVHDICLNDQFMMFLIDRAGIVGQDGKTHQGLYDLAMLSNIPNLLVLAPRDTKELEHMIDFGLKQTSPIAIRYPKGGSSKSRFENYDKISLGKFETLNNGSNIAILGLGTFFELSEKIYYILKEKGYNPTLINPRFVTPIDEKCLVELSKEHKYIVTLEDGILSGGFSSQIATCLMKNNINHIKLLSYGYPKDFIEHGNREEIMKLYGLDANIISEEIINKINKYRFGAVI